MGHDPVTIKIDDKKFLMRKRRKLNFYNQNNKNFVSYCDQKFPISNAIQLPNFEGEYPITIEYRILNKLKIEISENCNYKIHLENEGTVNSGESVELHFEPLEENILRIIDTELDDSGLDIKMRVNLESFDKNEDYEKDEVIDNLNDPYIDDVGQNVFEDSDSEDVTLYYSDIEIINDIDMLEEIDYIDGGAYRAVFKIKDDNALNLHGNHSGQVIKVAKNPKGKIANRKEFETWSAVKPDKKLRKYFCPIEHKGPDFKYIIMNEAKVVSSKSDHTQKLKDKDTIIRTIGDAIDGVEPPGDTGHGLDIKYKNIAQLGDKVVLVDYPYGGSFTVDKSVIDEFEQMDEEEKFSHFI